MIIVNGYRDVDVSNGEGLCNAVHIQPVENGWIVETNDRSLGVCGRRMVFTKIGDLQDALPSILGPCLPGRISLPTSAKSEPNRVSPTGAGTADLDPANHQ